MPGPRQDLQEQQIGEHCARGGEPGRIGASLPGVLNSMVYGHPTMGIITMSSIMFY